MEEYLNLPDYDQTDLKGNKKSPSYQQFLIFTELSVDLANEAVDKELGRIDMYTASDFLMKRELEPEAMLTGLMYIQRYKKRKNLGQKLQNNSFTSADLFLVSMMLASKYLFDNGTKENVVNEEWAEDAGIETDEINHLEVELLNELDWRLHVERKDFSLFNVKIRSELALRHWERHKSLSSSTYAEMIAILDNWSNLTDSVGEVVFYLVKILFGCTAVYISLLYSAHILIVCSTVHNVTKVMMCPTVKNPIALASPSILALSNDTVNNDETHDLKRYVNNMELVLDNINDSLIERNKLAAQGTETSVSDRNVVDNAESPASIGWDYDTYFSYNSFSLHQMVSLMYNRIHYLVK